MHPPAAFGAWRHPVAGKVRCALALCAALILGAWAYPSERVIFKEGCPGATVSGRFKGPQCSIRDYVLQAQAGQILRVELITDFPQVYYNVLPPGDGRPLANTSITGHRLWSGALPADGEYRVRVYLSRRAVHEAIIASYKMKLTMR